MSKKILSVVLALALVLTTFAVSAFAVGGTGFEEEGSTYKQTWALGEPVDNGDGTWSVDVSLTANYYVGAISFKVATPDEDALVGAELAGVTKGSALSYEANIKYNKTTGLVAIVPEPLSEDETGVNLTSGAVIATLKFKLTADSADIAIVNDPKTEDNIGGDLIAARLSDNNLTTSTQIVGQIVESVGVKRTLGSAMLPADLAKKASAEAGIIIDTHKTFGGTYAGVVYGFTQAAPATFRSTTYLTNNLEATNGGSLAFSRSIGAAGYGTGTVITVKNADGSEAKKYIVCIFGDVNGDGMINANDFTACKAGYADASTDVPANSIKRMAANCQNVNNANMMHKVNANDNAAIKSHYATGGTKLNMATLAATQYKFNNNYQ